MNQFKIYPKVYKNGKKHFKIILAEIYPDDVVINETGVQYNRNGITWIEEPCQKNIDSIVGMSLTCEFLNEERTEIAGHGETGEIEDGILLFNDATMIGVFTKGYIEEETINDKKYKFLIGEGDIDVFRYKPFVNKLERILDSGGDVYGSVEIFRKDNNEKIVYRYGYKPLGRIPEEFIFSGYAILGIRPADSQSRLLELNSEKGKEIKNMDEKTLALITDSVKQTISEMNNTVAEKESVITGLEKQIADKDRQIAELNSKVAEMEKCKANEKAVMEENEKLVSELNSYKEKNAIAELNQAIKDFTEAEKALVKEDIDAFMAKPQISEINSITSKIYAEIGKKIKGTKKISEKNSLSHEFDIFADIDPISEDTTFSSLF